LRNDKGKTDGIPVGNPTMILLGNPVMLDNNGENADDGKNDGSNSRGLGDGCI